MLYQFTTDGWAEFSVKITYIISNMVQQVSRTEYYLLSHITCDIRLKLRRWNVELKIYTLLSNEKIA